MIPLSRLKTFLFLVIIGVCALLISVNQFSAEVIGRRITNYTRTYAQSMKTHAPTTDDVTTVADVSSDSNKDVKVYFVSENNDTKISRDYDYGKNIIGNFTVRPKAHTVQNEEQSEKVTINIEEATVSKVTALNINSMSSSVSTSSVSASSLSTSTTSATTVSTSSPSASKAFQKVATEKNSCHQRYTIAEDILCMNTPNFLPNFKNPCWYAEDHLGSWQLLCLPYFQIIGVCKTGTTDLFRRLTHHPQIIGNHGLLQKETWYWTWHRYGHEVFHKERTAVMTFRDYLNMFNSREIGAQSTVLPNGTEYHSIVTGHGDPMDFWDHASWKAIPQNNPLADEPHVTTPALIRHINPDVKLILIFKDPIERLFSNYLHIGGRSAEDFHRDVMDSLALLRNEGCGVRRSMRGCLYTESILQRLKVPISGSFYSIHLKEWLKVFPRKQIFIMRTEDFAENSSDYLLRLFFFLRLDSLPTRELYRIASLPHFYQTKARDFAGSVKPETRLMLSSVFTPYNQELAKMLNDTRYLWDGTHSGIY